MLFRTIIEIAQVVLERRVNEAIADFHGGHGRLDFFCRIRKFPVIYPILSNDILEL